MAPQSGEQAAVEEEMLDRIVTAMRESDERGGRTHADLALAIERALDPWSVPLVESPAATEALAQRLWANQVFPLDLARRWAPLILRSVTEALSLGVNQSDPGRCPECGSEDESGCGARWHDTARSTQVIAAEDDDGPADEGEPDDA